MARASTCPQTRSSPKAKEESDMSDTTTLHSAVMAALADNPLNAMFLRS